MPDPDLERIIAELQKRREQLAELMQERDAKPGEDHRGQAPAPVQSDGTGEAPVHKSSATRP
jgi:hypothetical protein